MNWLHLVNQRKYSGIAFLAGICLFSYGDESKVLKSRFKFSSNSNIAAILPDL